MWNLRQKHEEQKCLENKRKLLFLGFATRKFPTLKKGCGLMKKVVSTKLLLGKPTNRGQIHCKM